MNAYFLVLYAGVNLSTVIEFCITAFASKWVRTTYLPSYMQASNDQPLDSFLLFFREGPVLGPAIRRSISANPRLNYNLGFFTPLFKIFFGRIFRVLLIASNSRILEKNNFD